MADRSQSDGTRATSPVVGKAMEATIVVLYLGVVTTVLFAGAVPEYRTAAGDEVAERTVADAVGDLEAAVPWPAVAADVRMRVSLPSTIAGESYRVTARSDRLVLEHPDQRVGAEAPLVLPNRVVSVSGTWESGSENVIRVTGSEEGLAVRLK